jgi:hypothetical protein
MIHLLTEIYYIYFREHSEGSRFAEEVYLPGIEIVSKIDLHEGV